MNYYAHTGAQNDYSDWEPLETHLKEVSDLASVFSAEFGASQWGKISGLWHDLGKYSSDFQEYLRRSFDKRNNQEDSEDPLINRPRHAIEGARYAVKQGKGILMAYGIAGHHGGLNDTEKLRDRLKNETVNGLPALFPTWLTLPLPDPPDFLKLESNMDQGNYAFRIATFGRFLFSCLVDADFLRTESFMDPSRCRYRPTAEISLVHIKNALAGYLEHKQNDSPATEVNRRRRQVLEACLSASKLEPGLFSLTVPTGGGKTLSSMAFALNHAVQFNLRRIIYAIPFTSIIEQNADVFRQALAPHAKSILEHHSNLDPRKQTQTSRLASENWDAPVIVTTNVQFFESLFSNRPSDCRKLHRIAKSVIILDEAQSIPTSLLKPCLAILKELARGYGCTIVLCTGLQPAIQKRDDFSIGLESVREIIPNPIDLHLSLKRVEPVAIGKIPDIELSDRLLKYKQVLCIVNTRAHAAKLFGLLSNNPNAVHLSALMCPQHRTRVIRLIRKRLKAGLPCQVISTQLIEAGVDLDFPVVYRALAGVDSIAQAAGRCNREGRLAKGHVYIFDLECPIPTGDMRQSADSARDVISRFPDPLSLDAIEDYFKLHYWKQTDAWDKYEVMACFAQYGQLMNFATAAESFKMIREAGKAVIVPYGLRGREIGRILMRGNDQAPPRDIYQWIQRLTVQIPLPQWNRLVEGGAIALYGPGESLPLLVNNNLYDRKLGLKPDGAAVMEVESLIV